MAIGQRLEHAAALVEAQLIAAIKRLAATGAPPRLIDAMHLGTLGGGKRLRPFLVLECAELFGVAATTALPAASALECVHCYSLIHDDLPSMDNDDLRRGKPTVHKAFDEWTAILAGDALLTLAFELLAAAEAPIDASMRAELIMALAKASGAAGMVGGQCLDLEAEKLGLPETPTATQVERLQAMKTGALIRVACEMGAILGRADPAQRRALAVFGEKIGGAFQIADDLLDAEGTTATLGKQTRKDAGKPTLIAAIGLEAAKTRLAMLEGEAQAALALFGHRAAVLHEAATFVVTRQH